MQNILPSWQISPVLCTHGKQHLFQHNETKVAIENSGSWDEFREQAEMCMYPIVTEFPKDACSLLFHIIYLFLFYIIYNLYIILFYIIYIIYIFIAAFISNTVRSKVFLATFLFSFILNNNKKSVETHTHKTEVWLFQSLICQLKNIISLYSSRRSGFCKHCQWNPFPTIKIHQ